VVVIRVILMGLGILCGVAAMALIAQLPHATYYGDGSDALTIIAVDVALFLAAWGCVWASGKLGRRQ
jgi:hypothetical protein